MRGASFRPIKALAVDLFPQTKHCELLILFERADYANGSSAEAVPAAAQATLSGRDSEPSDGTNPSNTDTSQATSVCLDPALEERESA